MVLLVGVLLVGTFFAIPLLKNLLPQSCLPLLRVLTFILAVLVAGTATLHKPGARPRLLRAAARLALPVGLGLLVWFQMTFGVRIPAAEGQTLSEVVAPPRLPSCDCGTMEDSLCLATRLSLDPLAIEKCWGSRRVGTNRFLWSSAYLLSAWGFLSLVALPWCQARRGLRTEPVAPIRATPGERRSLFLSYASEDRQMVERLAQDLTARGFQVWWDHWDMKVGDSLPGKIEEAIARSRWFGIVLSPDAVASRWVRTELDLALTLEIEEQHLSILPMLFRTCEIPLSLRRKLRADFTASYELGLTALLRRLEAER